MPTISERVLYRNKISVDMLAALQPLAPDYEIQVHHDDNSRISIAYRPTQDDWFQTFIVPYMVNNKDSEDPAIRMWVFMKIIPEKYEFLTAKQRIEAAVKIFKERLNAFERLTVYPACRSSRYAV